MKFLTLLQVWGLKYTKMAVYILDTSTKVNPMEMVFLSRPKIKKCMQVSGSLTSDMAKVFLLPKMAPDTKVSGKIVRDTAKARSNGLMELTILETTLMGKNRALDCSSGQTGHHTTVNFSKTKSKAAEYIDGLMEEATVASGKKIKCMDGEYLYGRTAVDTRENMLMTRSMEKASLSGLMVAFMMVYGRMDVNMG